MTVSRPDFPFEKAVALDAVSYRKNAENEDAITLQAYFYILSYSWASSWPIYLLVLAWLSGTSLFIYIIRKRHRLPSLHPFEATTVESESVVKPYQPKIKREWQFITKDVAVDEKHEDVKRGEKEIHLTGDSWIYFRSFIQKGNFMLTHQEIFKLVYNLEKKTISKNDRSRIKHAVDRLQSQLDELGGFRIELVWGKGYRLTISHSPEAGLPL